MDIREANYIIAIAKEGNITRAASSLFITQPGLTKSLKKLEDEFGGPLFVKVNKKLIPTELGAVVLKYSSEIIALFEKMNSEISTVQDAAQEELHFGAPAMCGNLYAPLAAKFCMAHPEIKFIPKELGGREIARELEEGTLDVAIAVYLEKNTDFTQKLIFTSEAAVAIDKSHPWASKEHISVEEFKGQGFVTVDETFNFNTLIRATFEKHNVTPKPVLLGKDLVWLMRYAELTKTPCIMPEAQLLQHAWSSMVIKPLTPTINFELSLVYPKKGLSNAAKKFINYVLDSEI